MSLSNELEETAIRFKTSVDRLAALFRANEVRSPRSLIAAFRHNEAFAAEWREIWREIAEADGGKLSLTTIGVILGAAFGGVGIAAMGGAVGLPLALVLGLGGLVIGAEVDAVRSGLKMKLHFLRIPKSLHRQIRDTAESTGMSTNELIVQALTAAFEDPNSTEPE
ncbi:MAG TPA: toxin-antitoxin system HicB family antitoxin [Actinobacteria bacterium]|nr:toxin-antitoxin system HicB family antitoxin [Actinomycetota bacterium]